MLDRKKTRKKKISFNFPSRMNQILILNFKMDMIQIFDFEMDRSQALPFKMDRI
jgi:hypothetical protein